MLKQEPMLKAMAVSQSEIPAMSLTLDADGRITAIDPACERTLGYTAAESRGTPFWSWLATTAEATEARESFLAAVETNEPLSLETRWISRSGEAVRIALAIQPQGHDRFAALGIALPFDRAIDLARDALSRYRELVDTVNGIVWEADARTFSFLYVSKQAERLLGYPVERWYEPGFWSEKIHPEDRAGAVDYCLRSTAALQPHEFEYRMIAADGKVVWLRDLVTVIPSEGKPYLLRGVMVDISAEKAAKREQERSERRFRTLLESSIIGVILGNMGGQVLDANDAFLRMVGYTRDDLAQGRIRWDHLTPDEFREKDLQALQELRTRGVLTAYEKEYLHKSGRRVPILLGATRLPESSDEAVAFVLDLSQLKEAEAKATEELARAVRLRDEFLLIASHELKTPLTPLRLNCELLARAFRGDSKALSGQAVFKLAESCVSQSKRLTELVENLLDVSRLSAGKLSLEKSSCDLGQLVGDVLARQRPRIEQSGCALQVTLEPGLVGSWDRSRIEQVAENILSNALKYGADKPVDIRVFRDGQEAVLEVEDRGLGVSPENSERIFDRFERAVSARHFGGLGLGLYISKQIIERHGGKIGVRSHFQRGSVFFVRLPLR